MVTFVMGKGFTPEESGPVARPANTGRRLSGSQWTRLEDGASSSVEDAKKTAIEDTKWKH